MKGQRYQRQKVFEGDHFQTYWYLQLDSHHTTTVRQKEITTTKSALATFASKFCIQSNLIVKSWSFSGCFGDVGWIWSFGLKEVDEEVNEVVDDELD